MKHLCCFCGSVINSRNIICEGANDLTYTRYFCLDCFKEGLHKLNKTKNPKRVSITKLIVFSMYAFIVGIIGFSLPKTINILNGLGETAYYGYLASYVVSSIIFWIFVKDFEFMTERESHFNQLKKTFKKLSEDLRTKTKTR